MCNSYDKCFIIGISGVTNGGKTTLSNKLQQLLPSVSVLHQDAYYYPEDSPNHVNVEGMDHQNYDILTSLDMDKMYQDIQCLAKNNIGDTQKYDLEYIQCLIVEGFTVLNYKPIEEICNLKYYLHLDKEECYRRRVQRTYEPPDIPGYFDKCVWPEHLKYLKEIHANPSIILISGDNCNASDIIMDDLNKALNRMELRKK